MLKRRSRMVSFRLSEDEYEGLKNICTIVGARSLSDIARDAVHRMLSDSPSPKKDLETEVQTLQGRMDVFDQELKRLVKLVQNGTAHETASTSS
jgi:hypothetical protein